MSGLEDLEISPLHSEEPEQSSGMGFSGSQEQDDYLETGIWSTTSAAQQADNDDEHQDLYRGAEEMVSRAVAEAPYESKERSSEERDFSSDRRATEKESSTDIPSLFGYPFLQQCDPRVLDIIYWRDVKASAQIFITGLIMLLAMMRYNILHVSCLAMMSVLLVAFVWRASIMVYQALKKMPITNPMQPYLDMEIEIPEEEMIKLTKRFSKYLLGLAKRSRRLVLIDDIVESLKFAMKVWLLSYVGAFFSGLTLITIGFLMLFSVPALYEKNQGQVDTSLTRVRKQVNDSLEKLKKRFPVLGKLKKQ